MKEWFSAAEIATMNLPALPVSLRQIKRMGTKWRRIGIEGVDWHVRKGSGGGFEYHCRLLPQRARTEFVRRCVKVEVPPPAAKSESWAFYERQTEKKKEAAKRRLTIILEGEALAQALGRGRREEAIRTVCERHGVCRASYYYWMDGLKGVARADWLPMLIPGVSQGGETRHAEIDEEAWDFLRADYLRAARPSFESCYRRLKEVAAEKGWNIPAVRTVRRRIEAIAPQIRVGAREGSEALKRLFPAQERDRSGFHALEGVNADGHRWDVFVRWEDGTVSRPVMVAFQDLYSNLMLAWWIDRSESKELVRLCFGDLLETYGIPERCWLDNGRAFASKWLTGGIPNRYRFKVRAEEPAGLLTQLGVEVHWTMPYAGQSKPIERGFGDFARDIARHPAFAGAWCGNDPLAKPEDYGSRAVPIAEFRKVVDEEIARHNRREGRETRVCQGRLSFLQAFEASYRQSLIRKATEEQVRLCLLMGEMVTVRQVDGSVHLLGNRYWHQDLLTVRGKKVSVRFDPQNVQQALPVYRHDGVLLCVAELVEAVGFADVDAARRHAAARNAWLKATKEQLAAERKMSLKDIAAMLPKIEPEVRPEAKIVRPMFGNLAAKIEEVPDFDAKLRAGRRKLRAIEEE